MAVPKICFQSHITISYDEHTNMTKWRKRRLAQIDRYKSFSQEESRKKTFIENFLETNILFWYEVSIVFMYAGLFVSYTHAQQSRCIVITV